jgi:hypothetical protein
VPCIPDMTTVGKGAEGYYDLRYWALHSSNLRGFRPQLNWQDRSTQPPREPPIPGQSHGRSSLPVNFSTCKASKVSLTKKSQTYGATKLREHGLLIIIPGFLGISHRGPFEQISSTRLLNEEISSFKDSTSLPS